jgi:hypothetical protein
MNKDVHKKIEETLNSFDEMQQAEAPAFFQTRLQAKMEKQLLSSSSHSWLPVRKPVLVIATLSLFFIMNLFLLREQSNKPAKSSTAETSSLQGFASDYNLTTSGGY